MGRYSWLLLAFACLALAYLLVWQRGFYTDDYSHRNWAIDPLTGQWRPLWSRERIGTFPVRILTCLFITTYAGLLPTHELLARAMAMLVVGTNALLLGWLVYRLLGSRLAAVIAGWLFLVPLYAQEALLWASAFGYVCAACLALLFLHAAWSALTQPGRGSRWNLAGSLAFAVMLLFVEPFAVAVALVPVLALAGAIREPSHARIMLRRSLRLLIGPLAVSIAYYLLLYRNSWVVSSRGGLDLSPTGILARIGVYGGRLVFLTGPLAWGGHVAGDALTIAIAALRGSWPGAALALIAALSLLLTVLTWRSEEREFQAPDRLGLIVLAGGLLWAASSLLLPGVLVEGQQLEYRLLYFPLGGASVSLASMAWLAAKRLRGAVWRQTLIALAGIALLVQTMGMMGYAHAYAARSRLDQQQVSALVRALPAQYLPDGSYIVPIETEAPLFGRPDSISAYLLGVFETPWSMRDALLRIWRRPDLQFVTSNRWAGMHFSDADGNSGQGSLRIQGVTVPVDRAVLFVYRAGRVLVVEQLALQKGDGTQRIVQFPLAGDLRRYGVPTIDIAVPEQSG